MGVGSVGGLAGALLMPRVVGRLGIGRAMVVSLVIACAGPLLTPLVQGPVALAVPLYTVSFFVTLFGVVLSSICAAVLRQGLTPNELLGRVTASERFVTAGLLPIAALLAGFLGDALGARWGLLIGALLLPLSLIPILTSPLPALITPDDAVPGDAVPGDAVPGDTTPGGPAETRE
jgi:hypothetical protein